MTSKPDVTPPRPAVRASVCEDRPTVRDLRRPRSRRLPDTAKHSAGRPRRGHAGMRSDSEIAVGVPVADRAAKLSTRRSRDEAAVAHGLRSIAAVGIAGRRRPATARTAVARRTGLTGPRPASMLSSRLGRASSRAVSVTSQPSSTSRHAGASPAASSALHASFSSTRTPTRAPPGSGARPRGQRRRRRDPVASRSCCLFRLAQRRSG